MRTIHARRRRLFRGFWGPVFRAAPLAKPHPPSAGQPKCSIGAAGRCPHFCRPAPMSDRCSWPLPPLLPASPNEKHRLYISISHFPPSPLLHLHLFPGLRNPFSQDFSIFQENILSRFLHPLGSLPRMDVLCEAQPERLLCQKFKLFLLRFPFVPKR